MKKVVLASLLACAAIASGLPSASAQQPVSLGTQAAAARRGQARRRSRRSRTQRSLHRRHAGAQATPQAKATAYEAYLKAYPQLLPVKVNPILSVSSCSCIAP